MNAIATLLNVLWATTLLSSSSSFKLPTLPAQLEVTSLTSSKGVVLTAWWEASDIDMRNVCAFSASRDQGKTWEKVNLHIASGYETAANPAIAADSQGRLYAVCMSVNGYSSGVLEISSSVDDGVTWSPWSTVIESQNGFPDKPILTVTPSSLHLAYTEIIATAASAPNHFKGVGNVMHIVSTDSGQTWSQPKLVSSDATQEHFDFSKHQVWGNQGASITSDRTGRLFASWGRYYGGGGILFSTSSGNGSSWSPPLTISDSDSDIDVPITQVITDESGKNIVVMWFKAHHFGKLYWIKSRDSGKTWSPKKLLTTAGTIPVMSRDSQGRLLLLWSEKTNSEGDVKTQYAVSSNFGDSFDTALTIGTGRYDDPSLIIGDYQGISPLPNGETLLFWINWKDHSSTIWQSRTSASPVIER